MTMKGGAPKNIEKHKFKKGHPNVSPGRPKGEHITTILKKIANGSPKRLIPDKLIKEYDIKSAGDALGIILFMKALRVSRLTVGDINAIKEIIDRIEGKVAQKTEISGAGGAPISIETIKKASLEELGVLENQIISGASSE